ncbi:hypothetical protein FOL47_010129 [Perkinsus chesapeaki]|uniref:Uncharacterized protein n=1 Tax=Perkinsus chesapeaki TaxID=330153 RepID=A0A7J6MQ75_PERCH|nr:hypothetical protein FOL47_010129 [Perkinsus chesapeaki]
MPNLPAKTLSTPKLGLVVGVWLIISYGLLTGYKGCDPKPVKWLIKCGKYQGEDKGVNYVMDVFGSSGTSLVIYTKLIFSNATGSASCLNCAFRYSPGYRYYKPLDGEGYCYCLKSVLGFINITKVSGGIALFALHPDSSSVTLFLGYRVVLNRGGR